MKAALGVKVEQRVLEHLARKHPGCKDCVVRALPTVRNSFDFICPVHGTLLFAAYEEVAWPITSSGKL